MTSLIPVYNRFMPCSSVFILFFNRKKMKFLSSSLIIFNFLCSSCQSYISIYEKHTKLVIYNTNTNLNTFIFYFSIMQLNIIIKCSQIYIKIKLIERHDAMFHNKHHHIHTHTRTYTHIKLSHFKIHLFYHMY